MDGIRDLSHTVGHSRTVGIFLLDAADFLEGTYLRILQSMQLFARDVRATFPGSRWAQLSEYGERECIAVVTLCDEARPVHRVFVTGGNEKLSG